MGNHLSAHLGQPPGTPGLIDGIKAGLLCTVEAASQLCSLREAVVYQILRLFVYAFNSVYLLPHVTVKRLCNFYGDNAVAPKGITCHEFFDREKMRQWKTFQFVIAMGWTLLVGWMTIAFMEWRMSRRYDRASIGKKAKQRLRQTKLIHFAQWKKSF